MKATPPSLDGVTAMVSLILGGVAWVFLTHGSVGYWCQCIWVGLGFAAFIFPTFRRSLTGGRRGSAVVADGQEQPIRATPPPVHKAHGQSRSEEREEAHAEVDKLTQRMRSIRARGFSAESNAKAPVPPTSTATDAPSASPRPSSPPPTASAATPPMPLCPRPS